MYLCGKVERQKLLKMRCKDVNAVEEKDCAKCHLPLCDAAVVFLRRNDDDGVKRKTALGCAGVAVAISEAMNEDSWKQREECKECVWYVR